MKSDARWTVALGGGETPDPSLIGGKAWSIAWMSGLGLSVPPAFVITTRACTAFLERDDLPLGLDEEIAAGIGWLEQQSGRSFGGGPRPLLVAVRSGAPVSMPGMMDTVLNLGINAATEALLGQECGDAQFARDTHCRFLDLYGSIVLKAPPIHVDGATDPAALKAQISAATGAILPDDVGAQLKGAVRAVFESWNSRRARRYRQHHGISDDLGTAVTVQAMAFGNIDDQSGTGVLFTRNPLDGSNVPYGEYMQRAQGEDLVSGRRTPQPLSVMEASVPEAHQQLLAAAHKLEEAQGDVQDIEFTVECGKLYLLQTRSAKRAPKAAVRIAVEMVKEGMIEPTEALRRITPEQIRILLSPRLADGAADGATVVAEGEGASPGVGQGMVVIDPDEAEDRARHGEAVVLARPTTSPNDVHGMIAACAILTEKGGSTSHAAVVGRALGRPCVVGCGEGRLVDLAGRIVTVDGQAGRVYDGRLAVVSPSEDDDPTLSQLLRWAAELSDIAVESTSPAGAIDLDLLPGDPAQLAEIFASVPRGAAVRGAVLASDEGVRAAITAGVAVIVTNPRLPALLQVAQAHIAAADRKGD